MSPMHNRYHRQALLPEIGADGQHRISARTALIVGCGALGTVAADALVRAGVGRLILVDRDVVELTNLQRQTLFDESDASTSRPKAVAAAERLVRINSEVKITSVIADVSSRSIERLLDVASASHMAGCDSDRSEPLAEEPQMARLVDVVIDATDNFQTRYLLNDACVKHHIPLVYGGAVGMIGMTMTIVPGVSPCLRCVFPEPPTPGTFPTCDTAGVLGAVTGVIGNLQAAEAIKVLTGKISDVSRSLQSVDVWRASMHAIDLTSGKDSACPCCARRDFQFLNAPADETWSLCGADAIQVTPRGARERLDLSRMHQRLQPHGPCTMTTHMLRATLAHEHLELTLFRDARAIIRGTTDPVRARAIYAKYIGE